MSRTLDKDGLVVGTADAIYTYSGRTMRPLDPDPALIDVEDIAHALSNQCRFTGHTRRFSSVAEHSVRVSQLVENTTPKLALEALLHDASEAYLSDLARPVKKAPGLGEVYLEAEARLERAIAVRFGLPIRAQMHALIKWADQYALEAEVAYFGHKDFAEAMGVSRGLDSDGDLWEPAAVPSGWSPAVAKSMFLETFERLGGVA